jgi:hypothetical protein
MADRLLDAIRNADEDGLTGTEIRDLLGGHARINDINGALSQLEAAGLVVRVGIGMKTAGRPANRWIATQATFGRRIGVGWKPHKSALVALVASVAHIGSSPGFSGLATKATEARPANCPSDTIWSCLARTARPDRGRRQRRHQHRSAARANSTSASFDGRPGRPVPMHGLLRLLRLSGQKLVQTIARTSRHR